MQNTMFVLKKSFDHGHFSMTPLMMATNKNNFVDVYRRRTVADVCGRVAVSRRKNLST